MDRIMRTYLVAVALFWLGVISIDGVMAVFLTDALGWSSSDTFIPIACMHISIALFELPTGAFADRYGRLRSTKLGLLIMMSAFVGLFSIPLLGIGQRVLPILWCGAFGVGWCFYSGSLVSSVVNTMKKRGQENRLPHLFSNQAVITNTVLLAATCYYGWQSSVSPQVSWLVAAAALLICSFFIHYGFKDLDDASSPAATSNRDLQGIVKESFKVLMHTPGLRRVLIVGSALYWQNALISFGVLLFSISNGKSLAEQVLTWPPKKTRLNLTSNLCARE